MNVIAYRAAVVLLAIGASAPLAGAQGASYREMTGTINRSIPIRVYLTVSGSGQVIGSYAYDRVGIPLTLYGTLGADGALDMSETDPVSGRGSGSFAGTLIGKQATGTWQSADGTKSFPFALADADPRVADLAPIEVTERRVLDPARPEGPAASVNLLLFAPRGSAAPLLSRELYGAKPPQSWPRERIDAFFDLYGDEAKRVYEDDPTSASLSWSWSVTDQVLWASRSWLCLRRTWREYTGGAHDNLGIDIYVFDLAQGRRLRLDDLVPQAKRAELDRQVMASLRAAEKLPPGKKLTDIGFLVDAVQASESFYLTPAGVFFVFSPYEIAPWARGTVTVVVPWKALDGLLAFRPDL
jgi:hypothetical protein